MKLHLILSFLSIASAFAVDSTPEQETVENKAPTGLDGLRKIRKLGAPNGDDGGNDGIDTPSGGGSCFSSMNMVEVQGKGSISMDSLKIGDYARASNGKFSRVLSFAHFDEETEAEYLQISAEGLMAPLEVTGRHFVFVSDKAVRADGVKTGDMLGNNMVTDIQVVKRTGLYAPITYSGDIMVSEVLASSYVSFLDEIHLDENMMTHMFFAPHRLACSINFSWCEKETYSKDGYSNWSNWAIKIMEVSYFLPAFVQNFLSVVGLFTVSSWATVEQFYLAPFASLAIAGCASYRALSKRSV